MPALLPCQFVGHSRARSENFASATSKTMDAHLLLLKLASRFDPPQRLCAPLDLTWPRFVPGDLKKPANSGGNSLASPAACCYVPCSQGGKPKCLRFLNVISIKLRPARFIAANRCCKPGFAATRFAPNSFTRCAISQSCSARLPPFRLFDTASARGTWTARLSNISMPGAIPSGSICWAIQRR